jgi:Flp pilus assembly protein TadG
MEHADRSASGHDRAGRAVFLCGVRTALWNASYAAIALGWRDRRGATALIVALAAIPLIGAIGIAVDAARLYMVQTRLKTAIDAAGLIAARDINSDQQTRDQNAISLFWANFQRSAPASTLGYLGTNITAVTVTKINSDVVAVRADGLMPTAFMNILGIQNVAVSSSNQSTRAATGTELALVLDNTGSMKGWPIQSAVAAATNLVNIVYGNGGQDTQPNLWVSVVPFTASVNVGASHTGWLKAGSYNAGAYANGSWRGCVMARYDTTDAATGLTNDSTDVPPAGPGGVPFLPFLYASTYPKYVVKDNKGNIAGTYGDNDWTPTNITEDRQVSLSDNIAVGPNLGCPQSAIVQSTGKEAPLPVLPLTASRAAVQAVISQMVANFRGGTFINLGLQAGWWTLSPRWRGASGWGDPKLPLDYNTPFMKKVIVLMTDGNNTWYDYPNGAPGAGPATVNKIDTNWKDDGDTDFTAYGRLSDYNKALKTNYSRGSVTSLIDSKMSQMCTRIKQQGIIIYAILFNHDGGVSQSTQTLFQNCATDAQHYFVDVTDQQLQATFSTIGGQLASLRLSR